MLIRCSEGIVSVFPECSQVCLLFLTLQSSDQIFPLSFQTLVAKVVMNSTHHTNDLLLKMLSPPRYMHMGTLKERWKHFPFDILFTLPQVNVISEI